MEEHGQWFDTCIVCALAEEARAVVKEFSERCDNVHFQQAFSNRNRYEYQHATLTNNTEEPLTVLITCMPFTGPVETVNSVRSLLEEFRPRFIAMAGICAGYKEKVALGDLVAASYAFHYEEGKVEANEEGEDRFRPEWRTHGPTRQIVQYINNFTEWETPVAEMKQRMLGRELWRSERPKCLSAPVASGMAVQGNNPFPRLLEHNRKALFLDQEVAAFYQTLQEFSDLHFLAVKAVCDYGDPDKNDDYHEYAARASAIYLLYFLQKYVTNTTMPRYDTPAPSDRAGPPPLHSSLAPDAKNRYQSWLLANTATFHIPGPFGVSLPIETAWAELNVVSKQGATKGSYQAQAVAEVGHRLVITGGPGTGKSTLCRKVVHDLSDLEEVVMWVSLPTLARRIQNGMSINTALADVATDGFDIPFDKREMLLAQADCLVADGLDECGDAVIRVAEALLSWAAAHPSTRIILTSRPIGYQIKYFAEWEHYALMPLTTDQVKIASWKLIQALVTDPTAVAKQIARFQEQLENNHVASLAAHIPLLLGFLIQLSLEGVDLVQQRADLYKQILDVWRQSRPQGRVWQIQPPDVPLAWRVLELAGWLLLSTENGQATCSHDWLVEQVSQQLAQEMGSRPLQISAIISNCLQFWHERGVLDRFHVGHQEVYTFVHATFDEYAAGRYLASLSLAEIQEWVRNKYRDARWREVILLAAGCGAAEAIVETLLGIDAQDGQQAVPALYLAAASIADSPTVPDTLAQAVAYRLSALLTSANATLAYEAAEQGVSLVKRVPDLFTPLLRPLFEHAQEWTRFSAIYLALESKVSMIDADELDVLLEFLTREDLSLRKRKAVYSRQEKVIISVGWDLQNRMIVRGAEMLASIRSDAKTRSLLQNLYDNDHAVSMGTHLELRRVLLDLGCDEFLKGRDRREEEKVEGSIFAPIVIQYQAEADRKVLEIILRLTSSRSPATKKRSKLRALTVLFHALQYLETPVQDWLVLRRLDDMQAIEAVFSGYIEALGLNKEELGQDAAWALAELQRLHQEGMGWKSLWSLLPNFPVNPEIPKRASLVVQREVLLRALHHPSVVVADGAAQLLAAAGEGKEELSSLLLTTNDERLLAILATVADRLWEAQARPLLIKRLDQGFTPGSWWLLEALPSLQGEHTDQRFQHMLLRALQAEEPRMAIAAAHAVQQLSISLLRVMVPALEAALLYWMGQGERAKAKSFSISDECPVCHTEPGNAYAHVNHLLHQL